MYRALYRKWRPARFEDVVGQQPIVTALQNQVKTGRVGHAYLFTGTRGTGKTTCAKIFAKAVNCPNCAEGDPCGTCPICRGIDDGSILDVTEIDAASNNGVDNIRDLRDETAYTPSVCRYKVYIIDEVHMLSTGAFNALLKIMEEPPSHVLFILATTEIHKVPATILSRCQRYDFARIQPAEIAARLEFVAKEEEIALEPAAAELIARLADGALRDALSILDTCAGVSPEVDEELVRRMAGVTERGYLFAIGDALAKGDAAAALAELAELRQKSVDLRRLCEELIGHYRSLMLACLPGGGELLSAASPEERQGYLDRAKQMRQPDAIRAIRRLGEALERMARGSDARIELELAFLAIALPEAAPVPVAAAAAAPAVAAAAQPFAAQSAAAPQPFAAQPVTAPQPFAAAPAAPVAAGPPISAAAAPVSAAPAAAPTPVGAASAAAPPPVDDLPPWESGPAPAEQPPQPQNAAAPAPSAPRPPAPAAPVSGQPAPRAPAPQPHDGPPPPFEPWPEVVRRVETADISLHAFLKNSRAYLDGRRVLIDGGDFFRDFIRQNRASQATLKQIIEEVDGQAHPIGPYIPPEAEPQPAQSMEDTLAAIRAQGVPVIERENE